MSALITGLGGGLVGLGVFCGVLAIRPARPQAARGPIRLSSLQAALRLSSVDGFVRRCLFGVIGGVLLGLTGWIAAALLGFGFGFAAQSLVGRRGARAQAMARVEALASWTESLRDLIVAGVAVESALKQSAIVAPAALQAEVGELAQRLANNEDVIDALGVFATKVADPVADLVVTALVSASGGRGGGRVADVLTAAAAAARAQVAMRLHVEAARAGTYTSARVVTSVFLAFAAGLWLLNRDFLEPFGTPIGQVVLLAIGGLFALCLGAMARLAEPEKQGRFFATRTEVAR